MSEPEIAPRLERMSRIVTLEAQQLLTAQQPLVATGDTFGDLLDIAARAMVLLVQHQESDPIAQRSSARSSTW